MLRIVDVRFQLLGLGNPPVDIGCAQSAKFANTFLEGNQFLNEIGYA